MTRPRALPPAPADVGVVAALPLEVGYLTDRLAASRTYEAAARSIIEGEHAGRIVVVCAGGVGQASARRTAELLLDGHRPRWIISAGFGGALAPGLKLNDALVATEVVGTEGSRFTIDVTLPEPGLAGPDSPKVVTGRLLTVDKIVATAAEKAALRVQTQADVVDMETLAVARVCHERNVRFLAVRVVSDEADHDLPAEIAPLLTRAGARLYGSAARALWNRPAAIMDFWNLHRQSQEAADRLADVTLALISALPA